MVGIAGKTLTLPDTAARVGFADGQLLLVESLPESQAPAEPSRAATGINV